MSLIDDFGNPDRSPRARRLAKAAHALPYVLVFYLAVAAAEWVGLFSVAGSWYGLALIAPFYALLAASGFHQALARLCVRCMAEVPADAPVRAVRQRGLLRLAHTRGWLLFLVILGWFAVAAVIRWAAGWSLEDSSWLRAPADLFAFAWLWSEWVHHRYRPWCPYCRRWDDDGGPREPSPDPDRGGVKTG